MFYYSYVLKKRIKHITRKEKSLRVCFGAKFGKSYG